MNEPLSYPPMMKTRISPRVDGERGGGHLIETSHPYYCLIQSSLYLPTNIRSNLLKYFQDSKLNFLFKFLNRATPFEIQSRLFTFTSHIVRSAIRVMKTSKWSLNTFASYVQPLFIDSTNLTCTGTFYFVAFVDWIM